MFLYENKDLFRGLIIATQDYFGIDSTYIEKDFWVVTVLKEILKKNQNYVF